MQAFAAAYLPRSSLLALRTDPDADDVPVVVKTSNDAVVACAPDLQPRISSRLEARIIDAVSSSRLTIIVGPTGCGKSTKVPALLLDGLIRSRGDGSQILCTQPRRLAVVAVASRVASERGVPLGGAEVGYQIGQSNLSTKGTRLLFTTAGILLEDLRANGLAALTRFRCIVLDECHERSPESDLVLTIIKSFMRAHPAEPIRLVLMSATFNHDRYRSYFSDVPGCEDAQSVNLETAGSIDAMYSRVQVHYIEEIVRMLPDGGDYAELGRAMRLHPEEELAGDDGGKSITDEMLRLVSSLVRSLDNREPTEGAFMIFAPTYRHLEQIYDRLSTLMGVSINVLHSSVDIEDCLRSMSSKRRKTGKRKILLASAIADSSVTVPGVSVVIDLCRALQVKWNVSTRNYAAKAVWASKSVCEQRKGRTGRTCPGQVFRLVTRGFYVSALESWDVPQLTLSSCQNEALSLMCSSHKVMSDPAGLLKRCLDTPPDEVLRDSLKYLTEIGSCELKGRSNKAKLAPTMYGELLAALPFSITDSVVFVAGAQLGLLYETLALRAITSHKPAPIVHHFGNSYVSDSLLQQYYPDVRTSDQSSVALANLSAYLYWEANFNASRSEAARMLFREKARKQDDDQSPDCGIWHWTEEMEENHVEWCRQHGINPSSVRSIAEMVDTTVSALFNSHFEPAWLRCASPTPIWRRPDDWEGEGCFDEYNMIWNVYGDDNAPLLCEALTALCVDKGQSKMATSAALAMRGDRSHQTYVEKRRNAPVACVHFLSGHCRFGDKCRNSHSPDAKRPMCRYFLSGNCSNGDDCIFSHGEDEAPAPVEPKTGPLNAIAPIIDSLTLLEGCPAWFKKEAKQLLLLGECNFTFAFSLMGLGTYPAAMSKYEDLPGETASMMGGVDATRLHADTRVQSLVQSRGVRTFSWNFPFTGSEEDEAGNEALLLGTFHSLTALVSACGASYGTTYRFRIALQGDQLGRWALLRSALRTGWALSAWGPFDAHDFPGYKPSRANGDPFPPSNMRFYVFEYRHGHVV